MGARGPGPLLVRYKRVGPGYFSALDIPVIAGREFSGIDHAGSAPATITSQELARELKDRFGIKDPVGTTVRLPLEPVAYVPLSQSPRRAINLIIRTTSDPAAVVPSIRDDVRRMDPTLVLSDVRTLEDIRRQQSLNGAAEPAWLIGAFALVAPFLAGLGLYGILGHTVLHQRREIGSRMALGATGREIISQVLKSAGAMVAVGLAGGVCGVLALTRIMSNLLFGVSPMDPWVLASATAAMALVGLMAAALPASRAVRVDPTTALRSEG